MKASKMLSVFLSIAMLLSLLPANSAAANKADTGGDLIVNKSTTLEENGSYTIRMEAYGAGSVDSISIRKPTDIIIVMDVSGSMNDPDWATSNDPSWQVYNGWADTAIRLQNEGQEFYHNHGGTAYPVELQRITGYSGVYYAFNTSYGNYYEGGTLSNVDLVGYRCGYGPCNVAYRNNYAYRYAIPYNGDYAYFTNLTSYNAGNDTMLNSSNFNLYRNTNNITRIAAMQQAVNEFIATTAEQNAGVEEAEQHRIALIKYSGGYFANYEVGNHYQTSKPVRVDDDGTEYYRISDQFGSSVEVDGTTYYYNTNCAQILYESAYVSDSTKTALQTAVNSLNAGGPTQAAYGVALAHKVAQQNLQSAPDREQIVLFFTDGEPTSGVSFENAVANETIAGAKQLKEDCNAKVYTVNMMPASATTATMTNYMNYVSSNYPHAESLSTSGASADSKYYKQVRDMTDLNELFKEVSDNISSTNVTLDGTSQLRDYLSEEFFLCEDYSIVVQTQDYNGNNTWKDPVTVQEYPNTYAGSDIHVQVNEETGEIIVDGFSYKDNYIHEEYMSGGRLIPAGGKKLIVTVYGVLPTDEAVQNGYVATNLPGSGIYDGEEEVSPMVQELPKPQVKLTSKTYVWDYGRPAFLSASDWHQASVLHLGKTMNAFTTPNTSLEMDYGTASISANAANGFSYFPKTMQWDGYDTIYTIGKDAEDENVNTWAKINIVPANSVYYEDDFIAGSLNVEDGIVYTGGKKPANMSEEDWANLQNNWETVGDSEGAAEDPNGPVHGWIGDLSQAGSFSDGAAHIVEAISGQTNAELPSARFTFTGTGMDIYSFTDSTTGTILVSVAKQGGNTAYYVVDNYAASGSYYQIPTVTFSGDYGTYDVTVYVTAAAASQQRFTFYLDGIRVYNPLGSTEDETVSAAYANELNAAFSEVRNILSDGAVFIDKDAQGNTAVEMNYNDSDYARFAPEHEVYLDKNQSVTFAVEDGTSNYYIGLKALAGGATTAYVGNGSSLASISVAHTSDLYYKVTPYYDSATGNYVITVKNAGDAILAITKLRQTSAESKGIRLRSITESEALRYTALFETMEVKPYMAASQVEQVEIQRPASEKDEMTILYERLQRLTQKLFAGLNGWF